MAMTTKHSKVVTYFQGLLPKKQQGALGTNYYIVSKYLYLHYHNAYGLWNLVVTYNEEL